MNLEFFQICLLSGAGKIRLSEVGNLEQRCLLRLLRISANGLVAFWSNLRRRGLGLRRGWRLFAAWSLSQVSLLSIF